MASEGVWDTPSGAILWEIYTDLHGFAARGAELESGQLTTFQSSAPGGKPMEIGEYRSQYSVR